MDDTQANSFLEGLASKKRTPEEHYQVLLDGLRFAAQLWKQGGELGAAACALGVAVRYLQADPTIFREHLTNPLQALLEAAVMRAEGQNPRLFQVEWSGTRLNFAQDGIKAASMAAYDRLLMAGFSAAETARIIGKELRELRLSVEDSDVRGWRKNWKAAQPHAHKLYDLLKRLEADLFPDPPQNRVQAEQQAKRLLRIAASGTAGF